MSPYDRKRKRILKRFLVGFTLCLFSVILLGTVSYFFNGSLSVLINTNPLLVICVITLLAVVGYQPLDWAYGWLFKHILFPRRSRIFHLLHRLSQELALTNDLSELANLLVNTLGETLQLKTVSLLVRAPRSEGCVVASAYGWSVTDYRRLKLRPDAAILELMKTSGPQILLRDKMIRTLSWQEANKTNLDFEALHATCVIPLWVKSDLVGSINFMIPSSASSPLDEVDFRFFKDFSQSVAVSVHHALALEELKVSNEELQDAQSKLLQRAKLAAIEQLASGIAHEIHNPLTIISGKTQVLLLQKDRKIYDEKVEEVLKTIVKQTRRAADITKRLLMFSRTSSIPREKLRLETILEDTLSLIAYQTSLEGTEIRRLIGQDLPDFFGNVQELREVFLNLILNAIQATGPGGQILVGMTFQKAEKLFVIQVADNGPGIPAENLDKVFNPFFTTRPEGVGLGLFVTQQIVHRYGGSLRVESEPGDGTLFVMELPLEGVPPSPPPAPSVRELQIGEEEFHDSTLNRR